MTKTKGIRPRESPPICLGRTKGTGVNVVGFVARAAACAHGRFQPQPLDDPSAAPGVALAASNHWRDKRGRASLGWGLARAAAWAPGRFQPHALDDPRAAPGVAFERLRARHAAPPVPASSRPIYPTNPVARSFHGPIAQPSPVKSGRSESAAWHAARRRTSEPEQRLPSPLLPVDFLGYTIGKCYSAQTGPGAPGLLGHAPVAQEDRAPVWRDPRDDYAPHHVPGSRGTSGPAQPHAGWLGELLLPRPGEQSLPWGESKVSGTFPTASCEIKAW
jgi:hypothetical protein